MTDDSQRDAARRIQRLADRAPMATERLVAALDLPRDQPLLDGLLARNLSLSDLVTAADILDVPVTVLAGQVPVEQDLGVSLRLGVAPATAPREALQVAEKLLKHQALLDSWTGPAPSDLSVTVSRHGHYVTAGRETALRLRDEQELGDGPITDLAALVELSHVPVVYEPLPQGFCGLNVRYDDNGRAYRAIVVNCNDYWPRQRYTLAHELCHGLYDDPGHVIVDLIDVPEKDLVELRAETFARHLLLPSEAVQREMADARRAREPLAVTVPRLMLTYGISRAALLNALLADQAITDAEAAPFRSANVDLMMERAGLSEPWRAMCVDQHLPTGSRWLVGRAAEAYANGWIDISVMADLMGEDGESAQRRLAETGWQPQDRA